MRRAVFLDRDGVINRAIVRDGKPYPPHDVSELEILPGAAEAVERLKAAGFMTLAVTNQPDVARGKVSRESVEAINRQVGDTLALDDILTCFHDDSDNCECRKPRPGQFFPPGTNTGSISRSRLWLEIAGATYRPPTTRGAARSSSIMVIPNLSPPLSPTSPAGL